MTAPIRDNHGRFLKGQSGNPKGRLARQVETRYLDVMMSQVTEDDWAEITRAAVADAKDVKSKTGPQAREWLSKFIIPPPAQLHLIQKDTQVTITVTFGDEEDLLDNPGVIEGEILGQD